MKRRFILRHFLTIALILTDLGAILFSFQLAYFTRFESTFFLNYFPALKGIPDISLFYDPLWTLIPLWLLIFAWQGFYTESISSAYDEFILVFKGVVLAALVTMAMALAFGDGAYSRLVVGLWAAYSVFFIFLIREAAKTLFSNLFAHVSGPRYIWVIGRGKAAEAIRHAAERSATVRVHTTETAPQERAVQHAVEKEGLSEVILLQSSLSRDAILETARICELHFVNCQVVPDLFEMRRGQIIMNEFLGLPTFHVKPLSLHGANYTMKRAFDIALSLIVLTTLFIPLAMICFLIRIDSRGPILFSQERMGLRARKFKLFKFRTMILDADDHLEKLKHLSDRTGPVFKMKNDPRVTNVGRWLRALSIDELPQIINVLRGDMSLVGPRPQVLWEAAAYDEHAKKRLRVLPGITGLWQVSGRAALSYEQMIDLDVFYVENWSLGLDLKIILRTLPAVFAKEGAY